LEESFLSSFVEFTGVETSDLFPLSLKIQFFRMMLFSAETETGTETGTGPGLGPGPGLNAIAVLRTLIFVRQQKNVQISHLTNAYFKLNYLSILKTHICFVHLPGYGLKR